MLNFLTTLPRRQKQLLMVICDAIILPMAFLAALALRWSSWDVSIYVPLLWQLLVAIPIIAIPIFIRLGLYRTVIRYADERLFLTAVYGITLTVSALGLIVFMTGTWGVPRTSFVIFWLLAVGFVVVSRALARRVVQGVERLRLVEKRQKIAIYGAGKAGVQLAMALRSSPEYKVLAFFDDDPELQGTEIFGLRVQSPDRAEKVIANFDLKGVILALPSVSRSVRSQIIQRLEPYGLILKILPGMAELVGGKVRVEDLREVGIEDLLGRDPVPPNEDMLSTCIEEKVVMVTGAGGSIGSELCRQILKRGPLKLVLFEQSEFALYSIEKELLQVGASVKIVSILGDVKDRELIERVLADHQVQTLYHAAAYKHVPLVEWNATSGIENNVIGTWVTAEASIKAKVETFVLVSTDKAVRPTNVMGASKRMAELVLQALSDRDKKQGTRFCMVRFGNVLGSSGSVVPLFKEQIRNGGPVTVTHPDVTRYFMTIPEAAQLVLQAGTMGEGGDVFVLDMGESVKIVDLARKMIELTGLSVKDEAHPEGDIELKVTGLRPGEKLFEELLIGDNVLPTSHPRIMRAEESFLTWVELRGALEQMSQACRLQKPQEARDLLKKCVREYQPQEGQSREWAASQVNAPGNAPASAKITTH